MDFPYDIAMGPKNGVMLRILGRRSVKNQERVEEHGGLQ
jgi:hypothetical protein